MKGENRLVINHETLLNILDGWLDNQFSQFSTQVTGFVENEDGNGYEISFKERVDSEGEDE